MRHSTRVLGTILLSLGLSSLGAPGSQQSTSRRPARDSAVANRPTPPYHKSAKEARPFPPLVPASRFTAYPVVERAYQIASEIPGVMAQQPCYCNCDQHFGHRSLLDCYASDHTAGCAVCVKETFFAFKLAKQGKSASQIRKAIVRGDWQKIDLNQPIR